jgi:hypothetical protein
VFYVLIEYRSMYVSRLVYRKRMEKAIAMQAAETQGLRRSPTRANFQKTPLNLFNNKEEEKGG